MGRTKIAVTAAEGDAGERADVVVARHEPGLSRRIARRLGLGGKLRINGRSRPPSTRVDAGDRIEIVTDDPSPAVVDPLRVLVERDDYVFVDKPSGLHTHRLRPDDPPTLSDLVITRFPECAQASEDPREGGALHRLDRDTTGVVAFARTPQAWATGRLAIGSTASKVYLALIERDLEPAEWSLQRCDEPFPRLQGVPGGWSPSTGWRLDAPLGPGGSRTRSEVRPDGLAATTWLWTLGPVDHGVCIGLRLRQGRRHQARAHLAHLGRPILGDVTYGSTMGGPLRLHAARLELFPGRFPAVEAPWPHTWPAPRTNDD